MLARWRSVAVGVAAGLLTTAALFGGVAAAATPTAAAGHVWTNRYFDKSGHLLRTTHEWRASSSAVTPSNAVRPNFGSVNCGSASVFRFHKDNPKQPYCYSGVGSGTVYVPYTYWVESGNWTAHYISNGNSHWMSPYESDFYQSYQTVTYLGLAAP